MRRYALRGDHGAVTAELALALPAVMVVVLAVLGVSSAGVAQLRAQDAARAAARAVVVGESEATMKEMVTQLAGPAAIVTITPTEQWTVVTVTVPVAGRWLAELHATGQATAWKEPTAGGHHDEAPQLP